MVKAKGPTFSLQFKRRRKNKTNYKRRLGFIKGGKPRLCVRLTNKSVIIQIISYLKKGDKVLCEVHSNKLKEYGWIPKRNAPTVYLTTILCMNKAKELGLKEFILDIGRKQASKGACVFAAAKAVLDSAQKLSENSINYNNDMIDEDRINAKIMSSYAKKLNQENKEIYDKKYSDYIKNKVKPEELDKKFDDVLSKIR